MEPYRILDKNKLLELNHNEAFVFACFLFKADYETGESHILQSNLAEACKCSVSKIQDHIKIFQEKDLVQIIPHYYKDENGMPRTANEYLLHTPNKEVDNYLTVRKSYFEQDIPPKVLGYVLLLKCICINGTNNCYYNLTEIASSLNIGYSTIKGKTGLHQLAIKHGLIIDEKIKYKGKKQTCHTIISPYIEIGYKTNLPKEDSKEYKWQTIQMRNYNIIREVCQENNIISPPYDAKLMSRLSAFYMDNFLRDALKKVLVSVKTHKIEHLKYICKILNIDLLPEPVIVEPFIIC